MAIAQLINVARETGNGVKLAFDFAFKIFNDTDLQVSLILNSTGVATLQTLGVDYSVEITGDEEGTVTYVVEPSALQDSFIKRAMPQDQQTQLPIEGGMPETTIENMVDKNTLLAQDLSERMDRALLLPETTTLTDVAIPAPSAGKALKWNPAEDGFINSTFDPDVQATLAEVSAAAAAVSESAAAVSAASAAADLVLTNADVVSTNTDVITTTDLVASVNLPVIQAGDDNKILEVNDAETGYDLTRSLSIDGTLAGDSDNNIPTEKAVKAYADTKTKAPATNTTNFIPQWNGANSKLLKDGIEKSTDGTLGGDSDAAVPTEKAVKAYADTKLSSVSQGNLNTAIGEVSITKNGPGSVNNNLTLPGGTYGFYPQIKAVASGGTVIDPFVIATIDSGISGTTPDLSGRATGNNPSESYTTRIHLWLKFGSGTGALTYFAQQRYVTASGHDHWIFILIDKFTKEMLASYQAPDHPSANQGGATEIDIPHPFGSYDPAKHEIVVVDNADLLAMRQRVTRQKSLLTIINEDYIIDDTERPVWTPREIIKIDEFGDMEGEVIKKIKTPEWAKLMISSPDFTLKRRLVKTLPSNILFRKLKLK